MRTLTTRHRLLGALIWLSPVIVVIIFMLLYHYATFQHKESKTEENADYVGLNYAQSNNSIIISEQKITPVKDATGKVEAVKVETKDGYIVKDKDGKVVERVVENDREKRTYGKDGRLKSKESKTTKN